MVVVDGVVMGPAPWEGALAVGAHSVSLRSDGDLGSPPASAPIALGEVTTVTLDLQVLDSELAVTPSPRHAAVSIDGVPVGLGGFRGRLPRGPHRVEVSLEGFVPVTRMVELVPGRPAEITVELERDRTTEAWRVANQPRVVFDAAIGGGLGPSLGGDVASTGCSGACSAGPAVALQARLHGGYELGSGIGFFVGLGYLEVQQSISQRQVVLKERPDALRQFPGTVEDDVALRGFMVGAAGAYHSRTEPWSWSARLGAGALVGEATDHRAGEFADGVDTHRPVLEERHGARAFYVAPEVRLGLRMNDWTELFLGLEAKVLLPLSDVRWQNERDAVTPSFLGYYDEESIVGSSLLFLPSLGARLEL